MKLPSFASLRSAAFLLALATLLQAGAPASPAMADWLVTRDGARLETRGAWSVKGKLVVFQDAAGKLSSLRVAEVDLDASHRATEEAVVAAAQADAEPEKPERRRSVRVITDKDVRPAAPLEGTEETENPAEEEAGKPASSPASGAGVVVGTWNQSRDAEADHVLINGALQNASSTTATDLKLKVMIFDETGALLATSQAALAATALPPGDKTEFKAEFPGNFSFATVRFETESRRLATRSPDQPGAEPASVSSDGGR